MYGVRKTAFQNPSIGYGKLGERLFSITPAIAEQELGNKLTVATNMPDELNKENIINVGENAIDINAFSECTLNNKKIYLNKSFIDQSNRFNINDLTYKVENNKLIKSNVSPQTQLVGDIEDLVIGVTEDGIPIKKVYLDTLKIGDSMKLKFTSKGILPIDVKSDYVARDFYYEIAKLCDIFISLNTRIYFSSTAFIERGGK